MPFKAGEDTVTLANAGTAHTASAGASKQRAFMQRLTVSGCVYGLQDLGLLGVCRGLDARRTRRRSLSKIYSIRNLRFD